MMEQPNGATSMASTPMRSGVMPTNEAPEAQDGEAASPEEQQAYDVFIDNGFQLIYSDQTFPQVLKKLSAGQDPVTNLAEAAAMVVMRLEDSAEKAGQQISPDIMLEAGAELLADLAAIAGKAGIHDYAQEEIDTAVLRAMDIYRAAQMQAGKIDPAKARAELDQMNQQGGMASGAAQAGMPAGNAPMGAAPGMGVK